MKFEYDVIIIGAGSGGLVVASGAARLGAKVLLIEHEKMGGDCLNYGCVPSKSFLKGAHLSKDLHGAAQYGLHYKQVSTDVVELMKRVHDVIDSIAPHDSVERYESKGGRVILGEGRIADRRTVSVSGKDFTAKNIVIATGSAPYVPPIKGLNTVPYYTNKSIFDIGAAPKHLIVLGGGPIGVELGQGFCHMGSRVTIIDRNPHLFKKDEVEVGPMMEKVFADDGIDVKLSATIIELQKKGDEIGVLIETDGQTQEIVGDMLLVSAGRTPATEGLGLDALGLETNKRGYIVTNKKQQTSIKNIYACGDVTGPYQFTHMAGHQASVVLKNVLFGLGAKVKYNAVPWVTYTKPEVAHVGHTEDSAKKSGIFGKAITVDLADNDRAIAENDTVGFLKLIVSKKRRLVGATLVGDKAGEIIPVATLAIIKKLKLSAFLSFIIAYPTEAEIFMAAALKDLKSSVKPWHTKLLKLIMRR